MLSTYYSDQCHLDVLSEGVGEVSDQDVELAATFNGTGSGANFGTIYVFGSLKRDIEFALCTNFWTMSFLEFP